MGNPKTPKVSSAYKKSPIFERTKPKIKKNPKTTLPVDKNSTTIDIYVTTTRKHADSQGICFQEELEETFAHDTQITPSPIKRNQKKR
ncbi:MAG: hypothetical protein MAG715_00689 [Methanonatronarchaeales archaeon]|nr:hypothetical protein [Methanonatronarchaeales archaeon]